MADKSNIEWTEATWNPVVGCSIVSPGCTNCYAMKMAARLEAMGQPIYQGLTQKSKAGAVWTGKVELSNWGQVIKPLSWKRPRKIFVNSMSDLFHESLTDDAIDTVVAVMVLAPQHIYQVLTKRSTRMRAYFADLDAVYLRVYNKILYDDAFKGLGFDAKSVSVSLNAWLAAGHLPHVWLGVSAEDQARANERIPDLLGTPTAVRWVSAEPLLGPIDFNQAVRGRIAIQQPHQQSPLGIGWIVVGGESGPDARPMHPDWARAIRDQCAAAGVAFFFKQWGAWSVTYDRDRDDPDWRRSPRDQWPKSRYLNLAGGHGFHGERVCFVERTGKKAAGRDLDGTIHDAMPALAGGR